MDDDTTSSWDEAARAARDGDRRALARLAAEIWPSVRRWALLELSDRAMAEDAAQNAMIRVLRHLGGWSPDRPFGPWLRTVVRNAARDVRVRRMEPVDAVDLAAEHAHGPDRAIDLRRAADRALVALGYCSPRQREIFDLCDLRGHSPIDAARTLGIAPGTARALLHQARKVVRTELLREDHGDLLALIAGGLHDV